MSGPSGRVRVVRVIRVGRRNVPFLLSNFNFILVLLGDGNIVSVVV